MMNLVALLETTQDRDRVLDAGLIFTPLDAVAVDTEKGGLPIRFRWHGETCEVVRRFGPERIESPWWTHGRGAKARDYFRVEDRRGRWLWMGRDTDGRWFVHGEWA